MPPPPLHMLNSNPNTMIFGGGALGSLLGGAPMNGISILIRRHTRDTISVFMYGGSKKVLFCKPGSRLPADTESAGTVVVNSPASGTMRSKHFGLSHPVYGICYGNSNWLRHLPHAFCDSDLASVSQPWSLCYPFLEVLTTVFLSCFSPISSSCNSSILQWCSSTLFCSLHGHHTSDCGLQIPFWLFLTFGGPWQHCHF